MFIMLLCHNTGVNVLISLCDGRSILTHSLMGKSNDTIMQLNKFDYFLSFFSPKVYRVH